VIFIKFLLHDQLNFDNYRKDYWFALKTKTQKETVRKGQSLSFG